MAICTGLRCTRIRRPVALDELYEAQDFIGNALAGRQVSEMTGGDGSSDVVVAAGERHLLDLPEGYHGVSGAGLASLTRRLVACCARHAARSGVARSRRWRFGSRIG
jgi:hypothetical protein